MKAAILAVGTEVTSGQIVNGNAAWLAERLTDLGFDVVLHEAVPDEGATILRALHECSNEAQLVLVTGGLGPTRDDFTRDWVARWLGVPLDYDPQSWEHLSRRLEAAGIRVAESNRQQCFFPSGAVVLPNPAGTANAFGGVHPQKGSHYWVLPGPPRELAAIWKGSLEGRLRALVPAGRKQELLTWQCLGKSEAELGEIVEQAVAGSGLETGYRVHRPYIEIKLWLPEGESGPGGSARPAIEALEQAIAPWVVGRRPSDLIDSWLARFAGEKLLLVDGGTEGIFLERALHRCREKGWTDASRIPEIRVASAGLSVGWPEAWVLEIRGNWLDPEWQFNLRDPVGQVAQGVAISPLKVDPAKASGVAGLRDRVLRWAVESALKWCVELPNDFPVGTNSHRP